MIEQSGDAGDATSFEVGRYQEGKAVVLAVSGEVDMLSAPHLSEAIRTALGGAPAALIVDLSKVEFLASAGMSVLVSAQSDAPPARFAVVAHGAATSRPIKLMGIDRVFPLYSTLDSALSDLADA